MNVEEIRHLLEQLSRELLEKYSQFLEANGYLDSDWWSEKPNAVDRFIALLKKPL